MQSSDLTPLNHLTTALRLRAIALLSFCLALVAILGGCTATRDAGPIDRPRSVREFAKTLGDYREVDFSFNASPSVALKESGVVALGKLDSLTPLTFEAEMSEGQPQPKALLAAIKLEEMVKGDRTDFPDGIIYVHIPISAVIDVDRYVNSPPIAQVAIVATTTQPLVEAGRWVSGKDVPASAIVSAYPDGLWFQGPDDSRMVGIEADPEQLPSAWNSPTTVDEYTEQLKQAR